MPRCLSPMGLGFTTRATGRGGSSRCSAARQASTASKRSCSIAMPSGATAPSSGSTRRGPRPTIQRSPGVRTRRAPSSTSFAFAISRPASTPMKEDHPGRERLRLLRHSRQRPLHPRRLSLLRHQAPRRPRTQRRPALHQDGPHPRRQANPIRLFHPIRQMARRSGQEGQESAGGQERPPQPADRLTCPVRFTPDKIEMPGFLSLAVILSAAKNPAADLTRTTARTFQPRSCSIRPRITG